MAVDYIVCTIPLRALLQILHVEAKSGEKTVKIKVPGSVFRDHVFRNPPNPPPAPQPGDEYHPNGSKRVHYVILGEDFSAPSAIQALIEIIEKLEELSPGVCVRLHEMTARRNNGRHVGKSPPEIHPTRMDLQREGTTKICGDWYLNTNISNEQKKNILELACQAAGLQFGKDVKVSF